MIYTKSPRLQIVNTASIWPLVLVLALISCKTPKAVEQSHEENRIEAISEEHETSQIDDTMTIRHSVINDTTLETTIIRKIITQNEKSAQSLQEENREASHQTKDTLTPAIIQKLLKGFAVACIGIAVVVAGFFLILLAIVLKVKK